jgi:hypothetical protein
MESTEQSRTCTDAPRVTALPPRPRPPVQRLTARPVPHDPWSADRYDAVAAADAFGAPVSGGLR